MVFQFTIAGPIPILGRNWNAPLRYYLCPLEHVPLGMYLGGTCPNVENSRSQNLPKKILEPKIRPNKILSQKFGQIEISETRKSQQFGENSTWKKF